MMNLCVEARRHSRRGESGAVLPPTLRPTGITRLRAPDSPSWTGHDCGDPLLAVVSQLAEAMRYRSALVIPGEYRSSRATRIRWNLSDAEEDTGHA